MIISDDSTVQLTPYKAYFGIHFPGLAEQLKALKDPGRAFLNKLPLKIKRCLDRPKQRFVNYGFNLFLKFLCLCVDSIYLMKRWWITAYISIYKYRKRRLITKFCGKRVGEIGSDSGRCD